MSRFPTCGHLDSWCGLCPSNAESAGKHHSGRTSKGNKYLRRALVEVAWAAARTSRRKTFFTALFLRISRRAGRKKAAVAVVHPVLLVVNYLIRDGVASVNSGPITSTGFTRTRHNRLCSRPEVPGFGVHFDQNSAPETS